MTRFEPEPPHSHGVQPRIGVLLINLGTPDSPEVKDVRRYLREFLMDRRVLDIPFLKRFFLVHFVIAPFRAPRSSAAYKKLWTKEGSPIKVHTEKLKNLLQDALGSDFDVEAAMRYQNPNIPSVLSTFKGRGYKKLIVIPLYPQYSSAANGSSIEAVLAELRSWETFPELRIVSQFCEQPLFIKAFARNGQRHLRKKQYDHVLFSYHGLPETQIRRAACENYCQLNDKCCSVYQVKNRYCYRAQCYHTSRLLAEELLLKAGQYTVCFQSRLGKTPWIKPYTDEVIVDLAKRGIKNLLVFSPSFVADCLETIVEIGMEYQHLFRQHGGSELDLVESLNAHEDWVDCLKNLTLQESALPEENFLRNN